MAIIQSHSSSSSYEITTLAFLATGPILVGGGRGGTTLGAAIGAAPCFSSPPASPSPCCIPSTALLLVGPSGGPAGGPITAADSSAAELVIGPAAGGGRGCGFTGTESASAASGRSSVSGTVVRRFCFFRLRATAFRPSSALTAASSSKALMASSLHTSSGVLPVRSAIVGSARRCRSSSIVSLCRPSAAKWRAVRPLVVFALILSPVV